LFLGGAIGEYHAASGKRWGSSSTSIRHSRRPPGRRSPSPCWRSPGWRRCAAAKDSPDPRQEWIC